MNNIDLPKDSSDLKLGSLLSGVVTTRKGTEIEGATVTIKSSDGQSILDTVTTGSDGKFNSFISENAIIELSKDYEPSREITVRDALETMRVGLRKTKMDGTLENFDFIAADYNHDGRVSVRDALEIMRYGLRKGEVDPEFIFVRGDLDSELTTRNLDYDKVISADLSSLSSPIEITTILTGDLNGSI